jgi:hypothetical protein
MEVVMLDKYCEKYSETNMGMVDVFGRIYERLGKLKVNSNVVAVCGEDIYRYLYYAHDIARAPKARIIFVEKEMNRYKRLKGILKILKDAGPNAGLGCHLGIAPEILCAAQKAIVLHGNILTYEDIPGYPLNKSARVEDLGLGIRFDKLINRAIGRLDTQKTLYNLTLKKVQILDGSRKRVNDQQCFRLLQQYFSILGADLSSINGVLPCSRWDDEDKSAQENWIFRCGKDIGTYTDDITGHKCSVAEHKVEFLKPGHIIDTKLYTYTNGGSMLSCLVVYK